MYKICAIDLDGTLFDNQKNISAKNIEAIKKAKELDCHIIIATGRPYNGVLPVLEKLGLTSNDDYVICYNGAKVMNVGTKEVIFKTTLNGITLKELYHESLRLNNYIHAFRINEDLISPKLNPYTDVEMKINKLACEVVDFNSINDDDEFLKIMLVDDKSKLDNTEININPHFHLDYSMVRSSNIFLEFLNKTSDKGKALIHLAKHLNVNLDEVMAIGDAGNDLNMILTAHMGVAMANGFSYIKEAANFVTLSNEEDGVAYAINKFINKTTN